MTTPFLSYFHEYWETENDKRRFKAPFGQYFLIHGILAIQRSAGVNQVLKIVDQYIEENEPDTISRYRNAFFEFALNQEQIYVHYPVPFKCKYFTMGMVTNVTTSVKCSIIVFYTLEKGSKTQLIYDFIKFGQKK